MFRRAQHTHTHVHTQTYTTKHRVDSHYHLKKKLHTSTCTQLHPSPAFGAPAGKLVPGGRSWDGGVAGLPLVLYPVFSCDLVLMLGDVSVVKVTEHKVKQSVSSWTVGLWGPESQCRWTRYWTGHDSSSTSSGSCHQTTRAKMWHLPAAVDAIFTSPFIFSAHSSSWQACLSPPHAAIAAAPLLKIDPVDSWWVRTGSLLQPEDDTTTSLLGNLFVLTTDYLAGDGCFSLKELLLWCLQSEHTAL